MTASTPGMPMALDFAPTRRGALNSYEICFADQKRMENVSWQNIANMLRRHVDDVRGACDVRPVLTASLKTTPTVSNLTPHQKNLIRRVRRGYMTVGSCSAKLGLSIAEVTKLADDAAVLR